jgi:hypothetical protein
VLVPNPAPLTSPNTANTAAPDLNMQPRVRLTYTESDGVTPVPGGSTIYPRGTIIGRRCDFQNLTFDQATQITANCMLVLPTLGVWAKIRAVQPDPLTEVAPGLYDKQVDLEVYPDAHLGENLMRGPSGNLGYLTYHFGVYVEPRPLLGEPTIQLPANIGVDLAVSSPPGAPGVNYDILFAPSGEMISLRGQNRAQVFLWVRDYTKVPDMLPSSLSPLTYDPNKFRRGGEQQIVGIRSASIGTAPVMWPDMATGQYASPPPPGQPLQDPFTLARKQLTGP